jgi:hypothetical protein
MFGNGNSRNRETDRPGSGRRIVRVQGGIMLGMLLDIVLRWRILVNNFQKKKADNINLLQVHWLTGIPVYRAVEHISAPRLCFY